MSSPKLQQPLAAAGESSKVDLQLAPAKSGLNSVKSGLSALSMTSSKAAEIEKAKAKRIDFKWICAMVVYMISLYGIYAGWFAAMLSIALAIRGTDFLHIQYRSKSSPVVYPATGSQLPPWMVIYDSMVAGTSG